MPRTVLIVDDNSIERSILSDMLEKEFNIICADSASEMISILRNQARIISAILLDLLMPETDGFEALRKIRDNAVYRQIPVIIISEHKDEDSQVKAMSLGANGYIFKPVNKQLMTYALENAISLREKSALVNAFQKDPLTGLLNSTLFLEMTETMIGQKPPGYYILSSIDIDNFKIINDQYGFSKGNEVLKSVARKIDEVANSLEGVCCRYSADKFGILYPAAFKDSKVITEFHHKVTKTGHGGPVVKIRAGRYHVDDLTVPVSAMYDRATLAEESIRGRYDVSIAEYTDSMRSQLLDEQKIINDMNSALTCGEFEPWFQPQYNHATGALIGAEALVRWKKDGTYISPAQFVPVFERNGFIYEMDQYVWDQVCFLIRKWIDRGQNPLPVSVNVSRRDLFHKDFLQTFINIIKKYDIPYHLIRIEVTESAFAEATKIIISKVVELIALGFVVEIDDFGSGYSSLNTLKDVPASIIKLDMKFFENTNNNQRGGNIIESVVRMSKWLGMAVIAEGVEDKEQADYLKSIGCYYIQGFYYAKPMPVSQYEKLLADSKKEPELTRLKTLKTLDNSEFWNPKSMETLIFNSYVGGACIFEYSNGISELLRINEQYVSELGGLLPKGTNMAQSSIVRFLDEENKQTVVTAIETAISTSKEAYCQVQLKENGHVEYVRITLRMIAQADERYLFYCVIQNMTQQHEAQRKQIDIAERLKEIMSNVNGGVSAIQIDDKGKSFFVFCNDKYYELYGYTRKEVEEKNLDIITTIIPEDFNDVMDKVKKLKEDRKPQIIDFRCKKKDGRLAFLRANASLMYMEGYGDVITSLVTDITKQRELSDKFKALIENINGGVTAIFMHEDEPQYVILNDQYYNIIGYTKKQFEDESPDIYQIIHPDDRELVKKQFIESGKHQGKYTMEFRLIGRNGGVRNILCNTNVISLFGIEEPVQLSVLNDITDLRKAQRKEGEALDKLSAVLNHVGNGITAMALRGEEFESLFINDRYFQLFGYTRDEYKEKTRDDAFAPIHPMDRERIREAVLTQGKKEGTITLEYRVIRGDGKEIWMSAIITITSLKGIDVPIQISVFSDITSEREAKDQLKFLNDSAHDILAQPDGNVAINKTIENIMEYFDGDRAYVVEMNQEKGVSCNTYEICAQGVTSQIDSLQNIPLDISQHWFEVLGSNNFVVHSDVYGLDESEEELRELLLRQNISSIILAPLWREGFLMGFVGIDNPKKSTNQLNHLKALADYIAILLMRRDLSAKIDNDQRAMRDLMDDTPGGFVRMKLSPSGAFVPIYSNKGFANMLGMSHEKLQQIFGQDVLAGVHPEDRQAVRTAGENMLAKGEAESARFRVKNGKGEYIWLTLYGRSTKDISGDIYLNVYYSDATKEMETEEKQNELLDNLPCGAALYEYDGKKLSVIHINKSYWELVERQPVDYLTASVFDVIHPDDRQITYQEIEAAIRQNRNFEINIRILCGESEYRPFHIDAKITKGKSGRHLLFSTYTPISDQTMSVQEMLPIALSTMMSASEDISYVKDKELNYICGSQSIVKMMGIESQRDLIGKNAYDMFEKSFADKFTQDDLSVILSGKPIIDVTENIPSIDGSIRLASTSKYPILDPSGNVIGVYCVSRDITAQREKESQLELLTGSIPGGIAAYTINEESVKISYFNDGYYKFSGYSREEYGEIVKNDPMAMVLEEDKPKIKAMIKGFRKNKTDGHVNSCVYRCYTKDGGYRWMSMKTVLSKIGENNFVVNVIRLDITEQQEEKERLRMSEEFNRIAIEQSGKIITHFNVKERTLTLPDSFNPIFVLPHVLNNMPDEQIELGRVSPDTAQIYRELFEGIVRGQSSGRATYKQKSTKGWRWMEAQFTTVFSNEGKPMSAVISFTDVTEELEKEVVYNKWQQSLNDRPVDSYTLFRYNLSKGSSFDSWEGKLLNVSGEDAKNTFDKQTSKYVRKYVYKEDRGKYITFVNSNTMLAEYYRGHRTDMLEYRELKDDGSTRWLRLTVDLVEYPNSKDIEAYLMYEDIDQRKKEDLLVLERSERDPLTGIYNRAAFIKKMEEILEFSDSLENHALLMLDIDNFKGINDTLGHGVGDQVLRDLTSKIRSILRQDDLIGRLGGDEFFVFLKSIPGDNTAASKAKRICELDIPIGESDGTVTVSVGIAMVPRDGSSFDQLYKKVDRALYQQKENGKNGYLFVQEQE